MIQNPKYKSAFQAGYNQGYQKGLDEGLADSTARFIMERDLIFIHGILAIVLIEKRHWKKETVEQLLQEIQNTWLSLGERENCEMSELVYKTTGISLEQMTQEILNAGREE